MSILDRSIVPRFSIGQRYRTRGRNAIVCTVSDIHTTYNAAGELVKIRYVATHEFLGQTITEYDIPDATIARGMSNGELAAIDGRA